MSQLFIPSPQFQGQMIKKVDFTLPSVPAREICNDILKIEW